MDDAQRKKIESILDTLIECDDYFDNKADADCDQDGFIPNEEMKLMVAVREAIKTIEGMLV